MCFFRQANNNMITSRGFCFVHGDAAKLLACSKRDNSQRLLGQLQIVCALLRAGEQAALRPTTNDYLDGYTSFTEIVVRWANVSMIKYMHEQKGIELHSRMCAWAINANRAETLTYVVRAGGLVNGKWVMQWGVSCAALPVIMACHERGVEIPPDAGIMASRLGSVAVLKYVIDNGGLWDAEMVSVAAVGGFPDVVMYAIQNGCPWQGDEVCLLATSTGRVDILRYVREQAGIVIPNCMTVVAAQTGHTHVLRYMH